MATSKERVYTCGTLAVGSKEGITVLLGLRSECQKVWIQIRTDRMSVGPDLGPNCFQRLSADDKIKWPLARREFISVGPLAVGSKEGITVLSGT